MKYTKLNVQRIKMITQYSDLPEILVQCHGMANTETREIQPCMKNKIVKVTCKIIKRVA